MCPSTASRISRHAALVPGPEVCDRGAGPLLAANVMASDGLPASCPGLFIFRPLTQYRGELDEREAQAAWTRHVGLDPIGLIIEDLGPVAGCPRARQAVRTVDLPPLSVEDVGIRDRCDTGG